MDLVIRLSIIIGLIFLGMITSFWWVVVFGIIAVFFLKNFYELFLLGVVFDVIFFDPALPWYMHGMHTGILLGVVILGIFFHQIIKTPRHKKFPTL